MQAFALRALTAALLLTSLTALGACQSRDHAAEPMSMTAAPASSDEAQRQGQQPGQQLERMIIHTATLSVEAQDPKATSIAASELLTAQQGFVLNTQSHSGYKGYQSTTMTLRVPAAKFDETLTKLRTLGKVRDEQRQGQDVTAEFIDTQARLKTQRELEQRLLGLLQQADNVDTVLKVESELARVRQNIEAAQGQEKYLTNQVQLATITFSINTPSGVTTRTLGAELSEALNDGREGAITVIGGLIRLILALLPVGLILGALTFATLKWAKRRKARQPAQR